MTRERSRDEGLGFAEGSLRGIVDVEQVTSRFGLAQRQQVLAAALWRTITSHPVYRMQADFDVERVVLERGGRAIRAEVRLFPPRGTPEVEIEARERTAWRDRIDALEPAIRWRGSVSDLVTDLLAALGPEVLERFCDEALPRARLEWAKQRAAAEGEDDADE